MRKLFLLLMLTCTMSASATPIDSCAFYKRQNDTLRHNLYMANNAILKVYSYTDIVKRNPKNLKYLRGWTLRALKQSKLRK